MFHAPTALDKMSFASSSCACSRVSSAIGSNESDPEPTISFWMRLASLMFSYSTYSTGVIRCSSRNGRNRFSTRHPVNPCPARCVVTPSKYSSAVDHPVNPYSSSSQGAAYTPSFFLGIPVVVATAIPGSAFLEVVVVGDEVRALLCRSELCAAEDTQQADDEDSECGHGIRNREVTGDDPGRRLRRKKLSAESAAERRIGLGQRQSRGSQRLKHETGFSCAGQLPAIMRSILIWRGKS